MKSLIGGISLLLLVGCSSPQQPIPRKTGSVVVDIPFAKVKVRLQPDPPPYPAEAKLAGIQGTVVVEVLINAEGVPIQATSISGPIELQPFAASYAKDWRFEPVLLAGVPQYAKFKIVMPFRLAK